MNVQIDTQMAPGYVTFIGRVPVAMVDDENTVNPCIPAFTLHLDPEEADAFDCYLRSPQPRGFRDFDGFGTVGLRDGVMLDIHRVYLQWDHSKPGHVELQAEVAHPVCAHWSANRDQGLMYLGPDEQARFAFALQMAMATASQAL